MRVHQEYLGVSTNRLMLVNPCQPFRVLCSLLDAASFVPRQVSLAHSPSSWNGLFTTIAGNMILGHSYVK